MQIKASFSVFFVGEEGSFLLLSVQLLFGTFRGVERGQIRTAIRIFRAWKSRQKFGIVGCCKLFLLVANVLLLLIYLSIS
jgi:hypothetical protein